MSVDTYIEQSDSQVLELLNEFSLGRVVDSGLSNKSESGMVSLCARFDYELADVAGASDYQNLAFLKISHCNLQTSSSETISLEVPLFQSYAQVLCNYGSSN